MEWKSNLQQSQIVASGFGHGIGLDHLAYPTTVIIADPGKIDE